MEIIDQAVEVGLLLPGHEVSTIVLELPNGGKNTHLAGRLPKQRFAYNNVCRTSCFVETLERSLHRRRIEVVSKTHIG